MAQVSTVLRWPLWSWRNLSVTAVAVLLLLYGMGRVIQPAKITLPKPTAIAGTSRLTGQAPWPNEPSSVASSPSPTTESSASSTTSTTSTSDGGGGKESVTKLATAFATAWSSSSRSQAEWNKGIEPFVTSDLADGLAQTDPAHVPATKVTGEAVLLTSSSHSAEVRVPTDGGSIVVTLQRESTDPWLISDVAPADQPPGAPTPDLQRRSNPPSS
jgi:hypothetical protein